MQLPMRPLCGLPPERAFAFTVEPIPDHGEDALAAIYADQRMLLAVADGCGGLGAQQLDNGRTGAYCASRLVVDELAQWADELPSWPENPRELGALGKALSTRLTQRLKQYADTHALPQGRIRGTLGKRLPTTLCAALARDGARRLELLLIWAGDSRAFLLTEEGLCQLTDDDAAGSDPLSHLYRDTPLSNFLSADGEFHLNIRRVSAAAPCALLLTTDGLFSPLPTPMELEEQLLLAADCDSFARFGQRLLRFCQRKPSDDITVVGLLAQGTGWTAMRPLLAQQEKLLKQRFITPLRRRRMKREIAEALWSEYRKEYLLSERVRHGRIDWLV